MLVCLVGCRQINPTQKKLYTISTPNEQWRHCDVTYRSYATIGFTCYGKEVFVCGMWTMEEE